MAQLKGAHKTGVANLPLHYGKAPAWLFQRMVKLAQAVTLAIVEDQGPEGVLTRLSQPVWFQAFGCVLGFDWHSSGVTTTVCGALKEGLRGLEGDTGLYVAGGKGGTSRKTPGEIHQAAERLGKDLGSLEYASRMTAKVDSSGLQDGYQIYHHNLFFTSSGRWAVVQQGMNEATRYARRYHWLGELVTDFVNEPHSAVCCDRRGVVLNLVAHESHEARTTIAQVAAQEHPDKLIKDLDRLKTLTLTHRHQVLLKDIHPKNIYRTLVKTYEHRPQTFEGLLALPGVGPKTVRALSLVADLAYGAPSSIEEPALYSFAHGGKDGYPYPVDRKTYDETIHLLSQAVRRAKMGDTERLDGLRRLERFWQGGRQDSADKQFRHKHRATPAHFW